MAKSVLAEFGRVDDRTLRRPPTKIRWAREMAITLLRRGSSDNAPGRPPPHLRPLPTHVVHQPLGCIHSHQPHWPRSCILRRNCDRLHVIIRMSVPNASIPCSSRPMEESSAWNRLPYRSLQTGALTDPPDVEPGSRVTPLPSISTNDDSTRKHRSSPTGAVDGAKGSCHRLPNECR